MQEKFSSGIIQFLYGVRYGEQQQTKPQALNWSQSISDFGIDLGWEQICLFPFPPKHTILAIHLGSLLAEIALCCCKLNGSAGWKAKPILTFWWNWWKMSWLQKLSTIGNRLSWAKLGAQTRAGAMLSALPSLYPVAWEMCAPNLS